LQGGFASWSSAGEAQDLIVNVDASELALDMRYDPHLLLVDVRREAEFADGHLRAAVNIPLSDLVDPGSMAIFEDHHNIYLHCSAGYRSVIASSMLKRQGIHNIRNVLGGWGSIREQPDIEIIRENSVLN
jgi:rhodanese-related sulfurtransferase